VAVAAGLVPPALFFALGLEGVGVRVFVRAVVFAPELGFAPEVLLATGVAGLLDTCAAGAVPLLWGGGAADVAPLLGAAAPDALAGAAV
jgi:hypothetical protein